MIPTSPKTISPEDELYSEVRALASLRPFDPASQFSTLVVRRIITEKSHLVVIVVSEIVLRVADHVVTQKSINLPILGLRPRGKSF
jgi:hypothetical protein